MIRSSRSRGTAVRSILFFCVVSICFGASGIALAQGGGDPNECDAPGDFPDVIVGDLPAISRWGTVNGITGFSVGTTSCNVGTCWLNWQSNTNQHPVIGQNAFRYKDGRFEQIGQGWLKHGFFALSEDLCSTECEATSGGHLGVNCSDPYSSGLNGSQGGLGPRSEVNPYTGEYPYPFTTINQGGNAIYKRIQIHNEDLDQNLNAGAVYYVDAMYVTPDDAAAGANLNNYSLRKAIASGTGNSVDFDVDNSSETLRERPAIVAWALNQPGLLLRILPVPNDGRFWVASAATELGNGVWHYEYAIQNTNSHRSAQAFEIPVPPHAQITNIGFHDVDYHSGEPYDLTDWAATVDNGVIRWETEAFEDNEDANALRWGTLYNFRFDADVAPTVNDATLGLFRPGTPQSLAIGVKAPIVCDSDGICDPGEDCTNCPSDCSDQGGVTACCGDGFCDGGETACTCIADCGAPPLDELLTCGDGQDNDCDGQTDCNDSDCCNDGSCSGPDFDSDTFTICDCNDGNSNVWAKPGEVTNLSMSHAGGTTTLSWSAPLDPGALNIVYEAIRSENAGNFVTAGSCLAGSGATSMVDLDTPPAGRVYNYVVRATNGCSASEGEGDLGRTSEGMPREALTCP